MTSTSLVTRRPAYITIEYTWMKCTTALSVVFLGCGAQDSVVIPRGRSSTSGVDSRFEEVRKVVLV